MKKALIAILALAVLAAGVIFAVGQTAAGSKDHARHGRRHRGSGMAFKALGLTDDQKAKLKEFRTASRTNIKPVRDALKAKRQRMKSQLFAVLTGEQKAKLAEMKAKAGERRKARKAAKAEKVSE